MALNFTKRIEFVTFETGYMPDDEEEISHGKAWADIRTLKGNEVAVFKSTGLKANTKFIIRYRSGLNVSWKIKYKNNVYDIESITNDDEKNRTITIFAHSPLRYNSEV